MIVVWCRKVRPLALWEDHAKLNSVLGTAHGHTELMRLANIYRDTHDFWPSLPNLVEQILGPPTAAARARHRQPQVPKDALVASAWLPRTAASVAEQTDPEHVDWGET